MWCGVVCCVVLCCVVCSYIVNKAGGLIFNRDLAPGVPRLSTNEYLRSASTFHSLYAIASQVRPCSGALRTELLL